MGKSKGVLVAERKGEGLNIDHDLHGLQNPSKHTEKGTPPILPGDPKPLKLTLCPNFHRKALKFLHLKGAGEIKRTAGEQLSRTEAEAEHGKMKPLAKSN